MHLKHTNDNLRGLHRRFAFKHHGLNLYELAGDPTWSHSVIILDEKFRSNKVFCIVSGLEDLR